MTRRSIVATTWMAVPFVVLLTLPRAAGAQVPGLDVAVEYLAGDNIYLGVGSNEGIAPEDTLFVYRSAGGEYLGALVVLSSTADRAVVVFAGDPFPVTRGTMLHVTLAGGAPVAEARPAGPVAAAAARERVSILGPEISGRVAFEMNAFQSTTQFQSNQLEQVGRTFATPSVSLRASIHNLPGDLRLRTNLRASYRYSSTDVVQPAQFVRIYQASLGKVTGPVRFALGRFYSPFETFSGFWDGVLTRFGGNGFGGGFAVGLEPERADETFSSDLPKYTLFLDYRLERRNVRYSGDVSFHQVRPRTDLLTHSFVGVSNRLRFERVSVGHDLQLDRNPETGSWAVSRLQVRTSLPLAKGVDLHVRYAFRQPYLLWRTENVLSARREQAGAGVSYWSSHGTFGVDVTANRFDGGALSYTYSSSFSVVRTPILGLGVSGSATYWTQGGANALQWSSGLSHHFGSAPARVSYQQYRTEIGTRTFQTDAVDLSLLLPLARRVQSSIMGRTQWGDNLRTHSLYISLSTSF